MFDMNSRARRITLGALVCAAAAAVTACAHAQQAAPPADSASPHQYDGARGRHGGMHGGMHGDRMFGGLDLTKDQHAQIRLIHDRYQLRADSLRMNGAGRDSTNRAAFHAMMTQEMSEIRAVLTPDQQKQFDDRMAKMRERHRMHGGNGTPRDSAGGPPA